MPPEKTIQQQIDDLTGQVAQLQRDTAKAQGYAEAAMTVQNASNKGDEGEKDDTKGDEDGDKDEDEDKEKGDDKDGKKKKGGSKRSYLFLVIFGVVAVLAAIGILIYHLMVGRYHVTTKDAYVNGDLVRLQPQVPGTVTLITVDQTQPVKLGQVLVALDPHDAEVSLEQAKANLAQTVRDVVQLFSEERQQKAMVAAQEAQVTLADQELHRDQALIGVHGVSQEEVDRMRENQRTARAGLASARASLESVHAQIRGTRPDTHPRVLLAESNLRSAWLALNRTQVRSPLSGYMVRREVQLGEQVTPATEMVALAPLQNVWIDANFKETQLEKIRIGQPVNVRSDIYGSNVEYHGRVLGLTAGTGAALAILPPENATGNWIKIVQRLPVRIGLDPRQLADHPLFLGLSMKIDIDVHDLGGSPLSARPAWAAQMHTNVYAEQDAGVNRVIDQILRDNLPTGMAAAVANASP